MLKLNVGSGNKRIPGFSNIDSFSGSNPDYVINIEKQQLPFEDNSVDEVICHHILEHLGEGFFFFMKELYRVCCDSAKINIRVPHPRHDTFLIDPTHRRPIYAETIAMFSKQRNLRDAELGGRETPIALINEVDFEVVDVKYNLDPFYEEAFKQPNVTEKDCAYMVRSINNVIAEIVIDAKVVK